MKFFVFLTFLFNPAFVFASTKSDACISKENMRNKMNVIVSNIANLNTTRTPEGGPYRTKTFVCVEQNCEVQETLRTLTKYEPGHPDADASGYVLYPDINLMKEMESLTQANREYEVAANICR